MTTSITDFDDVHLPSTPHRSVVCASAILAAGGGDKILFTKSKESAVPDFLVTIDTSRVFALPVDQRTDVTAREREAGLALIEAGTIRGIWRIPGKHRNIGIWSAPDADSLHVTLTSLPIHPYAEFDVTALATHPLISGDYAYLESE